MTERTLSVALWGLGIASVLIVTFALATAVARGDAVTTTHPRPGWPVLVAWGAAGGALIVGVGRATRDALPRRIGIGVAMLAASIAAAVAVEVTIMRWAAARFGVQAADPDLVGWSTILSPMVVLVGLTTLAAAVLPGPGRTAARAFAALLGTGVILVVASNVPGALDGITPLGVPMGLAMATAAAVALVATVVAARPDGSYQEPER